MSCEVIKRCFFAHTLSSHIRFGAEVLDSHLFLCPLFFWVSLLYFLSKCNSSVNWSRPWCSQYHDGACSSSSMLTQTGWLSAKDDSAHHFILPHRSEEAETCQRSDEYRKEEEQGSINSSLALHAAIFGPRSVMKRAILSHNVFFWGVFCCYFWQSTIMINDIQEWWKSHVVRLFQWGLCLI